MKLFTKLSTATVLGATYIAFPHLLLAQSSGLTEIINGINQVGGTEGAALPNPEAAGGNVLETVGRIINGFLGVLGALFLILIIYAGFIWMTAGGSEEQVSKARRIMRDAVVGLLVVVLAYGITLFVFRILRDANLE